MAERTLPEIEQYNAVSREICEIPKYNALKAEKSISLYFTGTGEVIIAAWTGETYVFWVSVSKTEDAEHSAEIFHHIAYEELNYVTYFSKALAALGISEEKLKTYYHVKLKYESGVKLKKNEIPNWEGPFGHLYCKDQIQKNGAVFAEDVRQCVMQQRKRCALRECDGSYLPMLEQYAAELEKAEQYDISMQYLEELLLQEDYLCLSLDEKVKEVYLYCVCRCEELKKKK